MEYILKTKYNVETGEISQLLYQKIDDKVQELSAWVIRTQEENIMQSLIKMGWTPPPKKIYENKK